MQPSLMQDSITGKPCCRPPNTESQPLGRRVVAHVAVVTLAIADENEWLRDGIVVLIFAEVLFDIRIARAAPYAQMIDGGGKAMGNRRTKLVWSLAMDARGTVLEVGSGAKGAGPERWGQA